MVVEAIQKTDVMNKQYATYVSGESQTIPQAIVTNCVNVQFVDENTQLMLKFVKFGEKRL